MFCFGHFDKNWSECASGLDTIMAGGSRSGQPGAGDGSNMREVPATEGMNCGPMPAGQRLWVTAQREIEDGQNPSTRLRLGKVSHCNSGCTLSSRAGFL